MTWKKTLRVAFTIACVSIIEAVSVTTCSNTTAKQETLTSVRTASFDVSANPFGIVYALDGNAAFVALNDTLEVLNTTTFPPSLSHEIALPEATLREGITSPYIEGATGIAITKDGRFVLVTTFGLSAVIVDVTNAIANGTDAVVGALPGDISYGNSAIEVTISPDGTHAFVSQEDGSSTTFFQGSVEVIALNGSANGILSSSFVAAELLEFLVVGTAVSPDGRYLYATSEQATYYSSEGTLSVIDVAKLTSKNTSGSALVTRVSAGCGPVRVLASSDGRTVWVTARESNQLLAFNATALHSNTTADDALIASIYVGYSPVALIFARNQSRILTANSNRFTSAGATTGLSVVDVQAALRNSTSAVLGQIPTGKFSREFAVSPDGCIILVSEYGSKAVQAVDVSTLP
ncbi:hypothetical protein KCU65_g8714, partial [Aureobasidium melanogenum]